MSTDPTCSNYTAITEFPAFSFVLADLHAHVLALPFATLAVGLALNLLLGNGAGLSAFGGRHIVSEQDVGESRGASQQIDPGLSAENHEARLHGLALLRSLGSSYERWLALAVTAVALGALYAINGWDLPTYLGLALLALAIQQWIAHEHRIDGNALRDFVLAGGALAALAVVAYLPFYRGFVSPSQGVGLVPFSVRSPIADEVAIFGIPAFVVLSFVLLRLSHWVGGLTVALGAACLVLLTRATAGFGGWTLLWVSPSSPRAPRWRCASWARGQPRGISIPRAPTSAFQRSTSRPLAFQCRAHRPLALKCRGSLPHPPCASVTGRRCSSTAWQARRRRWWLPASLSTCAMSSAAAACSA